MIDAITATNASPAMNPDARGIRYTSAPFLCLRSHTEPTMPPRNMVNTTLNGTRIPIPTPVGDGTHLRILGFASSTVNTTPSTLKISSAYIAELGSALTPSFKICAKPAHLFEIGEVSSAAWIRLPWGSTLSTMPYASTSAGYIHDTAAAPNGPA